MEKARGSGILREWGPAAAVLAAFLVLAAVLPERGPAPADPPASGAEARPSAEAGAEEVAELCSTAGQVRWEDGGAASGVRVLVTALAGGEGGGKRAAGRAEVVSGPDGLFEARAPCGAELLATAPGLRAVRSRLEQLDGAERLVLLVGRPTRVLLTVTDRMGEPLSARLVERPGGAEPVDIPPGGVEVTVADPRGRAGRLEAVGFADRLWQPERSDRWEGGEDARRATMMMYAGHRTEVRVAAEDAPGLRRVLCIDGDRRGAPCRRGEDGWTCHCRKNARIGLWADRWSIPWVRERSLFATAGVELPEAVEACLRFPELPPEEARVVLIAPETLPRERAAEATVEAARSGEPVCAKVPSGQPLIAAAGATWSPGWGDAEAEHPAGTRTWRLSPTSDGRVDLPPGGGPVPWPTVK